MDCYGRDEQICRFMGRGQVHSHPFFLYYMGLADQACRHGSKIISNQIATIRFLVLILVAFFLPFLPFFHLPFTWLETFFHEISHGLIAIFTGGSIDHITLSRNGEGQCFYEGGLKSLVTFAGYLGASLWGSLIYLGASSSTKTAHEVAIGIVIFVLVSGLLWARDLNTWVILLVIVTMIFIPMWFVQKRAIQLFVQFIGVYVLVSSIKSPLELLGVSEQGDHLRMEQLTHLPKIVWVVSWIVLSVLLLSLLWRKSYKSPA